eukprot:TRINITY_DN6483_c0_g1_i1.p1 TRINITY_DN6483_c0_g1~~TRINITY_DN6483_c0_g1_i1.p1  ORF type:complete len:562 (-),score=122.34 TRINITY_DN6483_c0_g1_i1:59-1744(-)
MTSATPDETFTIGSEIIIEPELDLDDPVLGLDDDTVLPHSSSRYSPSLDTDDLTLESLSAFSTSISLDSDISLTKPRSIPAFLSFYFPLIRIVIANFLVGTAFTVFFPVVPIFFRRILGNGGASRLTGITKFNNGLLAMFISPLIGHLSDRFGRKKVLIGYMIFLCSIPLMYFLAVQFDLIIFGTIAASIPCMILIYVFLAFGSDIATSQLQQTQYFGVISGGFGISLVVGPIMGGLLSLVDESLVMLFSLSLLLIDIFFVYFTFPSTSTAKKPYTLLQEITRPSNVEISINKSQSADAELKTAEIPVGIVGSGNLQDRSVAKLRQIRDMAVEYPGVAMIIVVLFLSALADQDIMDTIGYYLFLKFGWEELELGLFLAWVGVKLVFWLAVGINILLYFLSQKTTVLIGILAFVVGHALIAFAFAGWFVYFAASITAVGAVVAPILQSIALSYVPKSKHGLMLGIFGGVKTISQMVGAIAMTNIYAHYSDVDKPNFFPGAPYLFGSGIYFFVFIFTFFLFRYLPSAPQEATATAQPEQVVDDVEDQGCEKGQQLNTIAVGKD